MARIRCRSAARSMWLVFAWVLSLCLMAQQVSLAQVTAPEPPTGWTDKSLSRAKSFMVSSAHPLATEAGLQILREGGNAIDAAVAVQLVLGLVEPQSSGLGGGAFLLYWDNAKRLVQSYDGREAAPASAGPDRFMKNGRPMAFDEVVFSGLSIGVPGTPRLIEHVHRQHGKLPWRKLFEPALKLAENGFAVTLRLHAMLRLMGPDAFEARARAYFFDGSGNARAPGYLLKNPEYARALRTLMDGGADAFYTGWIADEIVAAANNASHHSGGLTGADLQAYKIIERDPICFSYRTRRLCSMGPPSSGGLAVAMTLKLLEPFDVGVGRKQAMRGSAMHLIVEAEKLAYADRNEYIADPAFVKIPSGLLDEAYLNERRQLIDRKRAMQRARAGRPPGLMQRAYGEDATVEAAGTTHFSIVDRDGHAVAMTSTIEAGFGSRIWAAGFLLNNELTDFSFRPRDRSGAPIANAVGPGKRPRSSMAPTLIFDAKGDFEGALGSVGGNSIIYYVVKSLVALLDWEMDAQSAASLINFGSRGRGFELEFASDTLWQALKVKPYGHHISLRWPLSGTHIVVRRGGRLEGGADPRREGVAKGD